MAETNKRASTSSPKRSPHRAPQQGPQGREEPRRERRSGPGVAFEYIAATIVVAPKQLPGHMQGDEHLVGVRARTGRTLGAAEEPEPGSVLLQPGRTPSAAMPQRVDERLVDRQDPLLAPGRSARNSARLLHQRMLDSSEVRVERCHPQRGFALASPISPRYSARTAPRPFSRKRIASRSSSSIRVTYAGIRVFSTRLQVLITA